MKFIKENKRAMLDEAINNATKKQRELLLLLRWLLPFVEEKD
jgi:hypothetical protein